MTNHDATLVTGGKTLNVRIVTLTPPGSPTSPALGKGDACHFGKQLGHTH